MMRLPLVALLALSLTLALSCAQPEDIPSNVRDLRMLAMRLDPPELMAPQCPDPQDPQLSPALLAPFLVPLELTALVQDPAGEGRAIEWTLWSCPKGDALTCDDPNDRVRLGDGSQAAGAWRIPIEGLAVATVQGTDGPVPLLQRVIEEDTYRGLGGIRVPLFLHLRAGEEEIWAQKLMVFSCRLFPDMNANVNPELPDILLDGEVWPADSVPTVRGPGPFEVEPADFGDRQEDYVVPSFELQPVHLREAWKIAWHADFGRFSPNGTGGADFGGGEPRHRTEWVPKRGSAEPREVRFWFVVRDGRGGMSWTERTLRYEP